MNQRKRVLVTGGAGFIGSHLVEKLLRLDCEVIVLDDLSSGLKTNLLSDPYLDFIEGDIRNLSLVKKICSGIDIIFHLAEFIPNTKQVGPGHIIKFSIKNPFLDLDISVKGTLNILEAAKEEKIKVVFTSTAAVYGNPMETRLKETTPTNPVSPYGASKLSAENYCGVYHRAYQLPVTIARLFNVYGPRQNKYVMYDILNKLKKNSKKLIMLGSKHNERDFVYVKDAVEGLISLSMNDETNGQTYNLGTGISTSIETVVNIILDQLNIHPEIEYTGSSWKGDIKSLISDNSKIKNKGFKPTHDVKQGILKFIEWYFHNI